MANETGDFELEPTKKTWAKETKTMSEDCWSKIITIDVIPSKYELGETDARVSNLDSDLEAGTKQAMTIPKVRGAVRAGDNSSYYTPHYVPIGPHHVNHSSPRIEKEKLCCVGYLQSLSEDQTSGGLMGLVEKLEPQARACYPDGVGHHMTPEQFSKMLLRDGCYLLVCMVDYRRGRSADKLAHSTSSADGDKAQAGGGGDAQQDGGGSLSSDDHSTVLRDTVFLVENQIPFFVLQKIHERVTAGDTTTSSALESIAVFIQELLKAHLFISKQPRPAPPQRPPTCHLLHLSHGYLQPTSAPHHAAMEHNTARRCTGRWRRATEYCKCGNMSFKRRLFKDDDEWTFLDVLLQGGTLWVPRLRIDSNTWTILRNLMALEERMPRRPVTAYCVFMSQVACTVEDVELLQCRGILEQFLGSDEEVAQGFANLCRGVVFDVDNDDRNYLKPIWHRLHERCENRVHSFMGWFRQLKHMLITIALLVALIVIACQVTQTFYAVRYSRGGQQPKH